jgi:hypothetical protein
VVAAETLVAEPIDEANVIATATAVFFKLCLFMIFLSYLMIIKQAG